MSLPPPPRRPWEGIRDWFDGQGPAQSPFTALFRGRLFLRFISGWHWVTQSRAAAQPAAVAGALPTTPGISQIVCGPGAYTIDQGTAYTLTFDSSALTGFQVGNISIVPVSAGALAQAVKVTPIPPLNVEFAGSAVTNSAGSTASTS